MAIHGIEVLHEEILAHIFSFLKPLEILTASLVNKRWKKVISDCPELMENICVRFTRRNRNRGLKIFTNMSRNFCCFWFDYAKIDLDAILFLQKLGPKFRSLIFESNTVLVYLNNPNNKISNLDNLLELSLFCTNGHEAMFTHLPKLKALQFNIMSRHSKDDQYRIVELAKHTLVDLEIVDAILTRPNPHPAINPALQQIELILEQIQQMRVPDVDERVARILEIEGLKLKRLKLPCLYRLDSAFQALCASQQSIVTLELKNIRALQDPNMVMICNSLPRIEELDLSYSKRIDKSVVEIFQLKRLKKLNLSSCRGIRNESFRSAIEELACTELEVLHLKYVKSDSTILSSLLSLLPNLRTVTLDEGYTLDSKWVECPAARTRKTRMYLNQPNL